MYADAHVGDVGGRGAYPTCRLPQTQRPRDRGLHQREVLRQGHPQGRALRRLPLSHIGFRRSNRSRQRYRERQCGLPPDRLPAF